MIPELLGPLVTFCFSTSITPGPNVIMVTASGATFGFRRTLPHLLGITLGFPVLVVAIGLGLGTAFQALPILHDGLKVVGSAYLLYLAWRIATAERPHEGQAGGRPLTFLQAAAFQWVNPKAWAMALTAVTVYAPSQSLAAVALVALVFGAINLPSVSLWVTLGQQLRRFLTDARRLRLFNWVMAALLIASMAPLVLAPILK